MCVMQYFCLWVHGLVLEVMPKSAERDWSHFISFFPTAIKMEVGWHCLCGFVCLVAGICLVFDLFVWGIVVWLELSAMWWYPFQGLHCSIQGLSEKASWSILHEICPITPRDVMTQESIPPSFFGYSTSPLFNKNHIRFLQEHCKHFQGQRGISNKINSKVWNVLFM